MSANDAQATYQAAQQLYQSDDHKRLEVLLDEALRRFPDHGRLLELEGLRLHAAGNYRLSFRTLEHAAMLTPLEAPAQLAMADAYRRCGRKEDARTVLTFLAERENLPTALLPRLTTGLGQIGEYQLALEVCREAAAREPDRDEPLYGMAFYMSRLEYPVECVLPLLRRAVSLAPECTLYRLGLAVACGRAGHWTEAYEVSCLLPPAEVCCVNCLKFLIKVFEWKGDDQRHDACCGRLVELTRNAKLRPAASSEAEPS